MLVFLFVFLIIIIFVFVFVETLPSIINAYYVYPEKKNIKCMLLKINKRKFDSIILFKDINNEEEYILKLKKSYLNKDYIPNEFKILNSPKKSYYKHLTDLLDEDSIFMITYGKSKYDEYFLLSAKKIIEEELEPIERLPKHLKKRLYITNSSNTIL